jgi:predicted porin
MQKKLIALAVAGLSTAAFAQTNVTIYGVADVSAQGFNTGKGTQQAGAAAYNSGSKFGLVSNNSLIGFKGTEDLGNGLKGLFQIETNVNLTGSTNNTSANSSGVGTGGNLFSSARDSFVGLNSKYGTVLGGYLSTPYRSTIAGLDVMPGSTGAMANHNLFGKANFAASAAASSNAYGVQGVSYTAAFRTTAIAYAMPTLYGFNGSIAYTGNGSNSATTCLNNSNTCNANQGASGMSVALGWDGYGVGIRGAFQQVKTNLGVPGTVNSNPALVNGVTSYLIGAQYTGVPGLKVAAAYGRTAAGMNGQTVGTNGTVGSAKGTQNSVWVGASYRFGNNEPALMYASNSNMSGLNQNNTAGNQVYGGQEGATQWGARWGYYLSKRTQVYGLVSQIKNNANGTYDFLGQQSSNPMYGGARVTTYGAGMRTNF